ncbi:MAG: DUF1273 domain-containing protein [Clostridiales bacterium]|nr:DUF1273 domain-containing protein [Clostridiales bacterium]
MIFKKYCCFTGHRELPPASSAAFRQLQADLHKAVTDAVAEGYNVFISGGALGFDLLAAEEVLRQKIIRPELSLRLMIPYAGQSARYAARDKARYEALLLQADETHCLSEIYTRDCMFRRNERMVLHAERCIAYLRKGRGGTFMTVNMAQRKGIEVVLL